MKASHVLKRYRWLFLAMLIIGGLGGMLKNKMYKPSTKVAMQASVEPVTLVASEVRRDTLSKQQKAQIKEAKLGMTEVSKSAGSGLGISRSKVWRSKGGRTKSKYGRKRRRR